MDSFYQYKLELISSFNLLEFSVIALFYLLVIFFATNWLIEPLWKRFRDWFIARCHKKYHRQFPEQFHCYINSIKCQSCGYLKPFDSFILWSVLICLIVFCTVGYISLANWLLYLNYLSTVRII